MNQKLRRVEIDYNTNGEWDRIRVEDADRECVEVYRSQIEAFKRVGKVLDDIVEVRGLSDALNRLFRRLGHKEE